MKILLINQDWFAAEWRAQGHEVLVMGTGNHCDVRVKEPLVSWRTLCGEFSPDCIIVHDNSSPILISGLEDAEIPTLFYSVDAQHHTHYHKYVGGAFDVTFVAQSDYLSQFIQEGCNAQWLPLWASRVVEASAEKKYDAVFVGTMDPKLNPERVRFFTEVKERVPLVIERGEYWKIFPFADIVVNQTVKGDLNFRVFEAMMCGAMLLTESSGNGLTDLFVPGTHLVTYTKGDVGEAAACITEFLADRDRCRRIAAAGRQEIVAKHLPQHRAATVMEEILKIKDHNPVRRYFGMMVNYSVLAVVMERNKNGPFLAAYMRALRCAEQGITGDETLTYELACHFVLAATIYDQKMHERTGAELMQKFLRKFPEQPLLALGVIRDALNHGEREAASEIAKSFKGPEHETFAMAERVIFDLLQSAP